MHPLIPVLAAIAGSSAYPFTTNKQKTFCGTGKPPQSFIDQARLFNQGNDPGPPVTSITVNLYLHFILDHHNQTPTNHSIQAQITRLQTSYAPSNIRFNHVNTSYTIGPEASNQQSDPWTDAVEPAFSDTCPSLRIGGYEDLNVYFFSGLVLSTDLYGICPFPNSPEERLEDPDIGGCVLDLSTLPYYDRSKLVIPPSIDPDEVGANHTLGFVAVHEIGHWFGLHHVFTDEGPMLGDCDTDTDLVDDTPVQLTYSQGCPVGKDSCLFSPGEDSIHNHMDYTDDICKTTFTPGQTKRMHEVFDLYRTPKINSTSTTTSRSKSSTELSPSTSFSSLYEREWPYSPSVSELDSPKPLVAVGGSHHRRGKRQITIPSTTILTTLTIELDPSDPRCTACPTPSTSSTVPPFPSNTSDPRNGTANATGSGSVIAGQTQPAAIQARHLPSFTLNQRAPTASPTETALTLIELPPLRKREDACDRDTVIYDDVAGTSGYTKRDLGANEAAATCSAASETITLWPVAKVDAHTPDSDVAWEEYEPVHPINHRDLQDVDYIEATRTTTTTSSFKRSTSTTTKTTTSYVGGDDMRVSPAEAVCSSFVKREVHEAFVPTKTSSVKSTKRGTSHARTTSSQTSDDNGGDDMRVFPTPAPFMYA